MKYLGIPDYERLRRLEIPEEKRLKVILDTDTYNEIDDQFAIFYALFSEDRIELKGIHAALFHNSRSDSPADGMEKSYEEIRRILGYAGRDEGLAYRGCRNPLKSETEYEESEAVDHLIHCAMECTAEEPLYVVGIGASTNIASAILKAPEIMDRIVVVWIGGNAYHWVEKEEFNLGQDPVAGKVLFDCGVPLIQVPAFGVTGFLLTSIPELEQCLEGENEIGDYLVRNVKEYQHETFAWSKPIWDVGAIGLLVNPGWAPSKIAHAPIITADGRYAYDDRRHLIRCVYEMDRDPMFQDMFQKIRNFRR